MKPLVVSLNREVMLINPEFTGMREFILSLLQENLPESYTYHNVLHTLYVTEKSLEIARYQGCGEKELELIHVAALWHDAGYTLTYVNHEEESCRLVRKHLPAFGYSYEDIDRICGMINATKIPQSPQNKLEEILADADLEYLGTPAFTAQSECLYHELRIMDPSLTKERWNQMQIAFLQKHHYHTKFCLENRNQVKQMHLQELIRSTVLQIDSDPGRNSRGLLTNSSNE